MSAALFNHLWQSTLCVGGAAIFARICGSAGAHIRYRIWLAASLKFLVPFSLLTTLGSQIGWASPERAVGAYLNAVQVIAAPVSVSDTPSQMMTHTSTSTAGLISGLLMVWAVGAIALTLRWLLRWNVTRALVRASSPTQINAPIAVNVTTNRVEPGVFGILRPTLLLPENIFRSLQPGQLDA